MQNCTELSQIASWSGNTDWKVTDWKVVYWRVNLLQCITLMSIKGHCVGFPPYYGHSLDSQLPD